MDERRERTLRPKPSSVVFAKDVPRLARFYREVVGMTVKVCLPVVGIEAARTTAAALGGGVADRSREWEARGFRACDGFDPEGNVFQVREAVS